MEEMGDDLGSRELVRHRAHMVDKPTGLTALHWMCEPKNQRKRRPGGHFRCGPKTLRKWN